MRILVVEDEKRLALAIRDILDTHNYLVDVSYDGESGFDNALSGIYDLILLDVMLPKMNGYTVARQLRAAGNSTPILMLTARSEVEDKVTGLDSGANYYLTKPFATEELLACIRALTRKPTDISSTTLSFGDLTLDTSTCMLSCNERSVRLSRKEFDIMSLLLQSGHQILPKESLILKVWGYDSNAEDNNVEVYISFLRKKLSHIKSRVSILTLRMIGYHLEET